MAQLLTIASSTRGKAMLLITILIYIRYLSIIKKKNITENKKDNFSPLDYVLRQ